MNLQHGQPWLSFNSTETDILFVNIALQRVVLIKISSDHL